MRGRALALGEVMTRTKPVTVPVTFKRVPASLYGLYKARCALNGTTLKAAFIEHMRRYVQRQDGK